MRLEITFNAPDHRYEPTSHDFKFTTRSADVLPYCTLKMRRYLKKKKKNTTCCLTSLKNACCSKKKKIKNGLDAILRSRGNRVIRREIKL